MNHLYVATNGLSVWVSEDRGETINRMPSSAGMYSGNQVWSLATDAHGTNMLLAGTDAGLFSLDVERQVWRSLPFSMDGVRLITAIAIDPQNENHLIVGTQPAALYESHDAGRTWSKANAAMKPYTEEGFFGGDREWRGSEPVKHWMRVTQVIFDPADSSLLWAGVEIDAIWKSVNGGRDWRRINKGLAHEDVHGLMASSHPDRGLLCTTANGVHHSLDGGEAWTQIKLETPSQYTRSIAERPGRDGVVFVTNGNGPPGSWGKLFRSGDHGATWRSVELPAPLESSLYFLAVCEADPRLVALSTSLGQLFVSEDGGESWRGVKRRLGEVRAMAWLTPRQPS